MKIDVEKSELQVLNNIAEEDWPKIRQIVLEIHDIDGRLQMIRSLLENRGYQVTFEQDQQLKNSMLYNMYALRPDDNDRQEEENFSRPAHRSSQWNSPTRLLADLQLYLKEKLPDYMIPAYYVPLAKLPLTVNGKVDRKALPDPQGTILRDDTDFIPPSSAEEEILVEIWVEVLGRETSKTTIGIDDNFFELGGHSLKATIVISKIQRIFNVQVPLVEIFKTPTIRNLAQYIRSAEMETLISREDRLVRLHAGTGNLKHLFLIHDGTGEVEGYVDFCKHIQNEFNLWGLRADRLENLAPCNVTIRELAKTYIESMKKVQPTGPYYIGGWSLGGTIAFEIAGQLEQSDEEIAFLALIDSPPPHKSLWRNVGEFNLKSELNFVKSYGFGSEIDEKFKILEGIEFNQFWPFVSNYLKTNNFDVDMVKKLIIRHGMHALPNYDRLDIEESIYYLNVGRTFRNARSSYIPDNKINTQVHYFKAAGSKQIKQGRWKKYCCQSIKYYTISGDHFSIFKMPNVVELAEVFDKVLHAAREAAAAKNNKT